MYNLNNWIKSTFVGVVGFILMYVSFPLIIFPNFMKFDFSDVVSLVAGFALGPIYGLLSVFIRNVLHLFITSTAGIGELANFLISGTFVFFSTFYYNKKHTKKNAFIGLVIGTFFMIVVGMIINYYVLLPFYSNIVPLEKIFKMASIFIEINSKFIYIIYIVLPFNFIKAFLNGMIVMLVYKKVSVILKDGNRGKNEHK